MEDARTRRPRRKLALALVEFDTARRLLRERDLEHRDDDFVPVVVVDARQAVMVSAVRVQHKPLGHVSVLNPRDPHNFARCAIEGADGAEPGRPRIEASALPAFGSTRDARAGPMLLVRDDLEGAGYDLVL